jgi:hypothetical protein
MKYNVTEQQSQFLQTLNLQPSGYRCFDLDATELKAAIDALVDARSTATGGQKRIISTLLKKFGITGGFSKRIRSGYFTDNNYVARLNYLTEMAQINPVTFSVTTDGNLDCSDWTALEQSILDQIEKAATLKMIPSDVSRILMDNYSIHASRKDATVDTLRQQVALSASLEAVTEAIQVSVQGDLFSEPEPEPVEEPVTEATNLMDLLYTNVIKPPMASFDEEGPSQADLDEIEAELAPEPVVVVEEEAPADDDEPEFVGLDEIYDDEEDEDEEEDEISGDTFVVTQAIRCGVFYGTIDNLGWTKDEDQVLDEDGDIVAHYDVEGYRYMLTFKESANAEAYADECKAETESLYYDRDCDDDDEADMQRVMDECNAILEAY